MGQYERLREERADKRRPKAHAKTKRRQLTAAQSVREEATRKRYTAWRYWRDTARARKAYREANSKNPIGGQDAQKN